MGEYVLVLSVQALDKEVHLGISFDALGELDAAPIRPAYHFNRINRPVLGIIELMGMFLNGLQVVLKLRDAFLEHATLAIEQFAGRCDRLLIKVVLDLFHGKIEPAQILDERELVHVVEVVEPVPV